MSLLSKTRFRFAALAVVLAAAAGLGVASAGSWGGGHGHGGDRCDYRSGGHMAAKSDKPGRFIPDRHIEGRLAFLKTELEITADQEQAWEMFAGVVRENAGKQAQMWQDLRGKQQQMKDRPALDERLTSRVEGMEQRLAMFKTLADAAKKLYTELTPEQQAQADDLMSRHHGRRSMF